VFGTTAGVGVAAYAANGFANQIGVSWLRLLSPFHYYIGAEPLKHGVAPAHVAVLVTISLASVAIGAWRFNHRDIGVR
jgi:ABC-2 type transport system permease protein